MFVERMRGDHLASASRPFVQMAPASLGVAGIVYVCWGWGGEAGGVQSEPSCNQAAIPYKNFWHKA